MTGRSVKTGFRRAVPVLLAAPLWLTPLGSLAAQSSGAAEEDRVTSLRPGPYTAGFRVVEALDSARAFVPLRDIRGERSPEPARPVQISLWYPAASGTGAGPMQAGEFRLLTATELTPGRSLDAEEREDRRRRFLARSIGFGTDSIAVDSLWSDPIELRREAEPLPGPFPTVLYFTSAGVNNPALPAWLASHGFVVASFPANGRMTEASLEFTPNPLSLDTGVDDAGFVYGVLRRIPWADTERLAVAAFSSGSLAALLWQMRDMQAAAIVTYEGWERYRRGADLLPRSVHFDPHRLRVPFLMLERAPDETSPDYAKVPDVVGHLPFADIHRVALRDAAHSDFLSHAAFGHTADHARIFGLSARMTLAFLDGHLRGDADALRRLHDMAPPPHDPYFEVRVSPARPPVPSEEEFFRLAEVDRPELARAYRAAARLVTPQRLFRESVLARAAAFAETPAAKAEILAIVVDAYPRSVSAHLALGQALAEDGRAEESRVALDRASELVSRDTTLSDDERARWEERIRGARRGSEP